MEEQSQEEQQEEQVQAVEEEEQEEQQQVQVQAVEEEDATLAAHDHPLNLAMTEEPEAESDDVVKKNLASLHHQLICLIDSFHANGDTSVSLVVEIGDSHLQHAKNLVSLLGCQQSRSTWIAKYKSAEVQLRTIANDEMETE